MNTVWGLDGDFLNVTVGGVYTRSSSSGTDPKGQKFLEECDYGWRNMDLWVRSRNKKTKQGIAHICIITSEKSEKEQIKNKIHAHLLLTVKELSIQNFCLSFITVKFLKNWEKELFACDQALLTIGCSITTIPLVTRRSLWSNFWLKRAFQLFHNPILPLAESVRILCIPKTKVSP